MTNMDSASAPKTDLNDENDLNRFWSIWRKLYLMTLQKFSGPKKLSQREEDEIIANFEPEPLVEEAPPNHPLLKTRVVQSRVGKHITVDGNECSINLASLNYLGLLEDEHIMNEACNSLRKYGVGSCGPRGFYGTTDVHLILEERLAKFMDMEEAIVYSYGFSTIASAIPAYAKRGDLIFADEAVHFAIQKGIDASKSTVYYFKHNDMCDLERLLLLQDDRDKVNPKKAAKVRRFLVAEGIYMNTGEVCPLPKLVSLRSKYKLRFFLEESVSFGTLGHTGRGVSEHFNINREEIDLICAAMEGAIATIGGFCVGSHFIAEHQRLSGLGYIFSASLPPMLAQAAISALDKLEREPYMFEELQLKARRLHKLFGKLTRFTLRGTDISPLKHLYLKNDALQEDEELELLRKITDECIKRGVAVVEAAYLHKLECSPVRPSIRISVSRLLNDAEIKHAFAVIEDVSSELL